MGEICPITDLPLPQWVNGVTTSESSGRFAARVNFRCSCKARQVVVNSNKSNRPSLEHCVADAYEKAINEHIGEGHFADGAEQLRQARDAVLEFIRRRDALPAQAEASGPVRFESARSFTNNPSSILNNMFPEDVPMTTADDATDGMDISSEGQQQQPPPVTAKKRLRSSGEDEASPREMKEKLAKAQRQVQDLTRQLAASRGAKARAEQTGAAELDDGSICFDNGLSAVRERKANATKEVDKLLRKLCFDKTTSMANRAMALDVLAKLTERYAANDDQVFALLSKERKETIETREYIVERVKKGLHILRRRRSKEEQRNYHVGCALVAPELANFGDTSGMLSRVATELELSREKKTGYVSVLRRAVDQRKKVDDAETDYHKPLCVDAEVVTTHGCGVIVKMTEGEEDGPWEVGISLF